MRTAVVSLTVFLGSFLCTAEAAVTAWTNPPIENAATGSGVATPSIPENTAVGTTKVTIAATASGAKTYAIATQDTGGKFTINATSGLLSLAAGHSFDYETKNKYILEITCTDTGDSMKGTATVTLSITDVSPVFASDTYTATILDDAAEDTLLITVKATDDSAGSNMDYSITGGNSKGDFAIGETTGAITVAKGKTLNMTATREYTLAVRASDGTNDGTAQVKVTVTTSNSGTSSFLASVMMISCAMVYTLM